MDLLSQYPVSLQSMEQNWGTENGESRNTGLNHEAKVAGQDEASQKCLTYEENKNIIDVIDPFPDIFDNFDSFFIYFF